MISLPALIHELTPEDIVHPFDRVRDEMRRRFGDDAVNKRIQPYDWSRWSLAFKLCQGARSVLDVGTAHGCFINGLALSGQFDLIKGIDIRDYSLFSQMHPDFERIIADAEKMPFKDKEFDVVVCMEVIEHLPDGKMERVLQELRRVAGKKLILTVPFCEPLPLPKYHSQQFRADRIYSFFPNAAYTLLLKQPVMRVPWLLIEETLHHQP